jgi:hypothetical protein
MGVLTCDLFTKPNPDPKLEGCATDDAQHIAPGAVGDHVKKIQIALNELGTVFIAVDGIYGPQTASAVTAYKNAPNRRIQQPWQTTADDIVGKGTIYYLDIEMYRLQGPAPVQSQYVSTTLMGPQHDHSKCPTRPYATSPGPDGHAQHLTCPLSVLGYGRRINIGGEGEAAYLNFEDMLTRVWDDRYWGPPRPFTEDVLPDACASDIYLRASPLNHEIAKEINRIALPGCRFIYADDANAFQEAFLFSLGVLLERVDVVDPRDQSIWQAYVIGMRGDRRYVDLPIVNPKTDGRLFPPPLR